MSLDDEKRAIIVRLEIEKAYDTYEEATMLADGGKWSGSVSRLYYAVFHAVSALLISNGHPVKSHKGAAVLFNQHFIRTGKVAPEFGVLYGRLEDLREEGDYNCHYKVSADELKSSLVPAKEMIDAIAAILRE